MKDRAGATVIIPRSAAKVLYLSILVYPNTQNELMAALDQMIRGTRNPNDMRGILV